MATGRVVADSSVYTQSVDGATMTRTILLEGVAGSGTDQYLINAGTDVVVPDVGDTHGVLTALKVHTITTRDVGSGFAQVVVEYRSGGLTSTQLKREPPADNSDNITWNISFTSESRLTTKDKDAADITVLRPTALAKGDGPASETISVQKLVPVGILRGERRELNPPTSRMRANIGKVNSVTHGSYSARTLLLSGIHAQTNNTSPDSAPAAYDGWHIVVYEFAYQPDTWDVEVVYKKFDGRQPTHDAGSRKNIKVYAEANFATALDLDFTDPS